jgi:dextranase
MAHRHNLAAMPYLAVYAASAAFWREHPDWALYDEKSQPVAFGEDFLGLMDPSMGRPWAQHLLRECDRALENLPFDGLHIDQYGDPKEAWDRSGERVDLPAAFGDFIRSARERFPGKTVLFNAVGNWPIDVLAASPEHFEYIEVWPPKSGLLDLREIVQGARKLSGGRPVVIALYLPANRPANVLLADALIFACGGSRIELGEGAQLLADPYFPKHQWIPEDLRRDLRRLYDFAVRYEEWIGPFIADAPELQVDAPAEVCWVARQSPTAAVVSLVNLAGLDPAPRWDEALHFPTPLRDVPVSIAAAGKPKRVLSAGPEAPIESAPVELDFSYSPGWISLTLPALDLWRVIAIEW